MNKDGTMSLSGQSRDVQSKISFDRVDGFEGVDVS